MKPTRRLWWALTFLASFLGAPTPTLRARAGDEKEGSRIDQGIATAYGSVVRYRRAVAVVERGRADAVLKVYEAWAGHSDATAEMPLDVMVDMYRAGDFETVKTLIENRRILNEHSLNMADLRIVMMMNTLTEISREKGWKICRSDSGNQGSGMRSDVDQTLYVYAKDADGDWKRAPELDHAAADLFQSKFEATEWVRGRPESRLTTRAVDVATIAGRDKYPDVNRVTVDLGNVQDGPFKERTFAVHVGETMEALRMTKGAYTYCGAVVQQMQLRALESIERQLMSGLADPRRASADSRKVHSLLEPLVPVLDTLVLNEIGPGSDGETRPSEVSRERAIEVMFDGLKPELLRGHAYDAAVANYLEFMHHLKDEIPGVKYLLRSSDDGARMLRSLDGGRPRGKPYESLATDAEKLTYLRDLLPGDAIPPDTLQRWKEAFDISAGLRNEHKKGGELTVKQVEAKFRTLAEQLMPEGGDWRDALHQARKEYDRRCIEFMQHNIVATSGERALAWVTHDPADPASHLDIEKVVDEDRLRKALELDGPAHDDEWKETRGKIFQNYADMARLQLLYSFRELPPSVIDRIVERAKAKGISEVDLKKLKDLRIEAKQWRFIFKRAWEFPSLYKRFGINMTKATASRLYADLHEWLLTESGYKDVGGRWLPEGLVKKIGLASYEARTSAFFAKRPIAGMVNRYVRNAVLNVGNIDGLIQVLRAYSTSGGDMEATEKAALGAAVAALPVYGQIAMFFETDVKGKVMMILCVASPAAGLIQMAFSIGDAGLEMHQHEYAAPLANELEDVLYRGYVGPSLYEFGQAPGQWKDEDRDALATATKEVERLQDATAPEERKESALARARVTRLSAARGAWEAYVAEQSRHEGGALFGAKAHAKQMRFPGESLLDRVTPKVFFAPGGVVDFEAAPLNAEEESRRTNLPAVIDAMEDAFVREDLGAELEGLDARHEAYRRRVAYEGKAKENHELMLQIRRDSLWPYMMGDTANEMVGARGYVERWIKARAEYLPARLAEVGVNAAGAELSSERVLDDLRDRLLEDQRSSKERWLGWQEAKKATEAGRRDLTENAKGVYAFQNVMAAAEDGAKTLGPLAEAIFLRNVPDAPPEVEISVRRSPGDTPSDVEYRPDVKVVANPRIYRPPYSVASYVLSAADAAAAATAKEYGGIPLDPTLVEDLRHEGRDAPSGNVLLTFAFCAEQSLPERSVPATMAGLPRLVKVRIPGQEKEGYLFGGAVHHVGPAPAVADELWYQAEFSGHIPQDGTGGTWRYPPVVRLSVRPDGTVGGACEYRTSRLGFEVDVEFTLTGATDPSGRLTIQIAGTAERSEPEATSIDRFHGRMIGWPRDRKQPVLGWAGSMALAKENGYTGHIAEITRTFEWKGDKPPVSLKEHYTPEKIAFHKRPRTEDIDLPWSFTLMGGNPQGQEGPTPLAGDWQTNAGPATLRQKGPFVYGWCRLGPSAIAHVFGEIRGRSFTFEYAHKQEHGHGDGLLSEDGRTLNTKTRGENGATSQWNMKR